MLEVVFNEGVKGTLKASKSYKKHKTLKRNHTDLSALDVIQIGFRLDVGALDGPVTGSKRQDAYKSLYGIGNRDESEVERFFAVLKKDFELLQKRAKHGDTIRIWTSNSPHEACGFAYLCHFLKEFSCKIKVIELPPFKLEGNNTCTSYTSWNEVSVEDLTEFQSFERPVSDIEKRMQGYLWNDILHEHSNLRAVVNGKLMSVPDDFYDHLIKKHLPDEPIVIKRLIGNIISKESIGVYDGWYALRIKKLIDKKLISVVGVQDPDHPYGILIEKTYMQKKL